MFDIKKFVDIGQYSSKFQNIYSIHKTLRSIIVWPRLKSKILETISLREYSKYQILHAVQNGLLEFLKQTSTRKLKSLLKVVFDETGYTLLHEAAYSNEIGILSYLLSLSPNVNIKGLRGVTPLHLAVKGNSSDAVMLLCRQKGLKINAQDAKGQTALDFACRLYRKEICQILLESGANPAIAEVDNVTCLHHAVRYNDCDMIKLLLKYGAQPDIKDNNGLSPINVAVNYGYLDAFLLCMESVRKYHENISIILDSPDNEGFTAVMSAVRFSQQHMIKPCLDIGSNLSLKQNEGKNFLHILAESELYDVLDSIDLTIVDVDEVDDNLNTALHLAVASGNFKMVQFLINKKASINTSNSNFQTPLLIACTSSDQFNPKELENIVKILLLHGASAEAKNKDKENILHILTKEGNFLLIELILKTIDPKVKTNIIDVLNINGDTALHVACASGNEEICELLIENNAKLSCVNKMEHMPVHEAIKHGHLNIVKLMINKNKLQSYYKDSDESSVLLMAARHDQIEVFKYLCQIGIDIFSKDEMGNNALFFACKRGNLKMVEFMIKENFDIRLKNLHQNTPLHEAAANGHYDLVRYLMSHGAVLSENVFSESPLTVALKNKHFTIANFFLNEKNWQETMKFRFKNGKRHMENLITYCPQTAAKLLDRGISEIQDGNQSDFRQMQYQLSFLDMGPMDAESVGIRYNGLLTAAKVKSELILNHPLSRALLTYKWNHFGWFLVTYDLLFYLIFLALYTFIVIWKSVIPNFTGNNCTSITTCNKPLSTLTQTFIYIVFSRLCVEGTKLLSGGRKYFENEMNITFMLANVLSLFSEIVSLDIDNYWMLSAITIWIIWMNLMYFLRNLTQAGIYVLMFYKVGFTVFKILFGFINIIFAFTFSMFILNSIEDPFKNPGFSFVKILSMMIGEVEYVKYFFNGDMPLMITKLIMMCIFIMVMPICFINLLVGTAVGDIEKMTKEAALRNKIQQVELLSNMESLYPRCIQELLYKPTIIKKMTEKDFYALLKERTKREESQMVDGLAN